MGRGRGRERSYGDWSKNRFSYFLSTGIEEFSDADLDFLRFIATYEREVGPSRYDLSSQAVYKYVWQRVPRLIEKGLIAELPPVKSKSPIPKKPLTLTLKGFCCYLAAWKNLEEAKAEVSRVLKKHSNLVPSIVKAWDALIEKHREDIVVKSLLEAASTGGELVEFNLYLDPLGNKKEEPEKFTVFIPNEFYFPFDASEEQDPRLDEAYEAFRLLERFILTVKFKISPDLKRAARSEDSEWSPPTGETEEPVEWAIYEVNQVLNEALPRLQNPETVLTGLFIDKLHQLIDADPNVFEEYSIRWSKGFLVEVRRLG
jgi:hypothetical protein